MEFMGTLSKPKELSLIQEPFSFTKKIASKLGNWWGNWGSKFTTIFTFYLCVGAYYYHVEGWTICDCIYFITVTITTVGFGDFHPSTDNSRVFTIFTILFGLTFVFTIINGAFTALLISTQEAILERIGEAKKSDDDDEKNNKKIAHMVEEMTKRHRLKSVVSIVGMLAIIFLGAAFFNQNEDWTFVQAVYFCVVTTTTVGYGDLNMVKESSRGFSVFYIFVSVIVVSFSIGSLASSHAEHHAMEKKIDALTRPLDLHMLRELDQNNDGVDKLEFLIEMLVQTGVADRENDIQPWLDRFEQLDKDSTGKLTKHDLQMLEDKQNAKANDLHQAVQVFKKTGAVKTIARQQIAPQPLKANLPVHPELQQSVQVTQDHENQWQSTRVQELSHEEV